MPARWKEFQQLQQIHPQAETTDCGRSLATRITNDANAQLMSHIMESGLAYCERSLRNVPDMKMRDESDQVLGSPLRNDAAEDV